MAVRSEDTPAGATQPKTGKASRGGSDEGPPSPEVTPAAERLAEETDREDLTQTQIEPGSPDELERLREENGRLRQALIDSGHAAAAKPYVPSFIMSEGVRQELWETGKSVDPATGALFERDPESGKITRTEPAREPERERPTGKTTDVTDQVPQPR